jgi:hypothetical protein
LELDRPACARVVGRRVADLPGGRLRVVRRRLGRHRRGKGGAGGHRDDGGAEAVMAMELHGDLLWVTVSWCRGGCTWKV